MLKNFLIITIRSLITQRFYTLINILGLAVGLACTLLISIYLVNEFSYDKFLKDSDQIYRISVEGKLTGKKLNIALTSAPMAETVINEFPVVETATRIVRMGAFLVSNDTNSYNEENLIVADKNFFKVFSFDIVEGNRDSMLLNPRSIVLTRTSAKKYFGTVDPIGKRLRMENQKSYYTVTGLIEDIPSNSHFHFDMIASLATFSQLNNNLWVSHNFYTYIKVRKGTDIPKLENSLQLLIEKYVAPQVVDYLGLPKSSYNEGPRTLRYHLQPLSKIHLFSHLDFEHEPNGNALYIYTFEAIALLILIIACLNFMNLSTANSANRAREVVLRKVIGSDRKMIVLQFLTESVVLSFIALILAFFLAEHSMTYFNHYLNINLQFTVLKNPFAVFLIISFTLALGLFAGSYPAIFISSYEPVKVLHGTLNKGIRNRKVRSVFVIFQFFISILIITLSLVVYAQVNLMLNKDLGFKKDQIVVIRRSDALKGQMENFKREILTNQNIESVSNSTSIPGRNFRLSTYFYDGDTGKMNILLNQIFVNYDFCEAYGLTMAKGRFFSSSIISDSSACVINETAERQINLPNIIGKKLLMPGATSKEGKKFEVVGIVKDFNFVSVDKPIEPLVISIMPVNCDGYINVRLNSKEMEESIIYLEKVWDKYSPSYPFVYFFLDQDFDQNYRSVIRTGRLFFIFSILSVFIACLGLFGLVSYSSIQRTREIGIRKAVGATFYQIIFLLIKETIVLILVATLIAWAAAYMFSKIWLKEFYTRITLSPKYFIIASFIVLILSIIVVLYQSYSAARHDPGEALKSE
jgi:putative ABC transport system permease protein